MSGVKDEPVILSDVESALREMQANHGLFPQADAHVSACPQVVIVGVSGGADSVCLLHLLCRLAAEWQLALHVAHLDHALRPDSAADARFVEQLATDWGLPYHAQRLTPGALHAAPGSVETAARRRRYQFLSDVALQQTPHGQQPMVALAHHADDQAETVLHHLVRGSGLQGLSGMRLVTALTAPAAESPPTSAEQLTLAESQPSVIQLVRPLLYVRRTSILHYLRQQQLTWRTDPTNTDEAYTRNYLRHTVLPALARINPAAVEALGRMASLAAEESERLAAYDRALLTTLQIGTTDLPTGPIVLDLNALRRQTQPTQRALLRMALHDLTLHESVLHDHVSAGHELSLAQLSDLCGLIQRADSGGPHPIVGNLAWSVAGATTDQSARLSLHRHDQLPFPVDHPLLTPGQQLAIPAVKEDEAVQLALGNGWALALQRLPVSAVPADWRSPGQPWRAFLDWEIAADLILTTATAGLSFAPLGMNGQRKSLGNFFTDHKIPVALRSRWPLLVGRCRDMLRQAAGPRTEAAVALDPVRKNSTARAAEVLWVCGLQLGHPARVTAATTTVLSLRFVYHEPETLDETGSEG